MSIKGFFWCFLIALSIAPGSVSLLILVTSVFSLLALSVLPEAHRSYHQHSSHCLTSQRLSSLLHHPLPLQPQLCASLPARRQGGGPEAGCPLLSEHPAPVPFGYARRAPQTKGCYLTCTQALDVQFPWTPSSPVGQWACLLTFMHPGTSLLSPSPCFMGSSLLPGTADDPQLGLMPRRAALAFPLTVMSPLESQLAGSGSAPTPAVPHSNSSPVLHQWDPLQWPQHRVAAHGTGALSPTMTCEHCCPCTWGRSGPLGEGVSALWG